MIVLRLLAYKHNVEEEEEEEEDKEITCLKESRGGETTSIYDDYMWQCVDLLKPEISVAGLDEKNVPVLSFYQKRTGFKQEATCSKRNLLSFGSCMVRFLSFFPQSC
ncbi:hypothetical protein Peur_051541 [Populus x canadensis]